MGLLRAMLTRSHSSVSLPRRLRFGHSSTTNRNGSQYGYYQSAGLFPVLYIGLLHGSIGDEVAEMFKEFGRKETAYRLCTHRHKAYYSLDRDDGRGDRP